jgi:hypothetical protein
LVSLLDGEVLVAHVPEAVEGVAGDHAGGEDLHVGALGMRRVFLGRGLS